jgi:hypothetical protein
MKEYLQSFWWFAGMLICVAIFELLNRGFKQELNKLFKQWDTSHHEIIVSEHSSDLYWDLVDFIKQLMLKSLNIFSLFAGLVAFASLLLKPVAAAPILSFCLGIITYRFALFKNWLGLKKYGEDKRPGKDLSDDE